MSEAGTPKACLHCGGSAVLRDRQTGELLHTGIGPQGHGCNICLGTGWDGVHPPLPGAKSGLSAETFTQLRDYLTANPATRGPWPWGGCP
jgi:hypothetical protein